MIIFMQDGVFRQVSDTEFKEISEEIGCMPPYKDSAEALLHEVADMGCDTDQHADLRERARKLLGLE